MLAPQSKRRGVLSKMALWPTIRGSACPMGQTPPDGLGPVFPGPGAALRRPLDAPIDLLAMVIRPPRLARRRASHRASNDLRSRFSGEPRATDRRVRREPLTRSRAAGRRRRSHGAPGVLGVRTRGVLRTTSTFRRDCPRSDGPATGASSRHPGARAEPGGSATAAQARRPAIGRPRRAFTTSAGRATPARRPGSARGQAPYAAGPQRDPAAAGPARRLSGKPSRRGPLPPRDPCRRGTPAAA
jgi:hypothetical protein